MDVGLLAKFREGKDKHWKEDKESPLTNEQKKVFTGLRYFPANKDLLFLLPLDKDTADVGKEIIIQTTGGDNQIYKKAGIINFRVEGKEINTPVLEDPEVEQFQYYLIFKDSTTGKETYENGRMLQVEKKGDKLVIDFNYAYNPYSAYNNNWDCPITPEENTLAVAIKAGEKNFT